MKRPALLSISRRQFCTGIAGCGILAACGSSDEPMRDAPGSAASCSTATALDVGAPSTFVLNTPVYFAAKFVFVNRDANGLYALTARCSHQGFTTRVQGTVFICPRHGSQFTFDGMVLNGPALTNLVHYAMCTLDNGNVGVFTQQIVPDSQRLNV